MERVFSLPMRNWNLQSSPMYPPPPSVFSLPMRNWNTGSAWTLRVAAGSFQPTYEELKHGFANVNAGLRVPFSAYLWGIETIHRYFPDESRHWVFSLPTRNWNPDIIQKAYAVKLVFSLPTRNWNASSIIRCVTIGFGFQPTYEELKLIKY